MAKDTLEQWDTTAANNTVITDAISLDGDVQTPAGVDDAIRELMSQASSSLATKAGDVASATTIDLDASEGLFSGQITGTTTITGVTLSEGRVRERRCAAALPITADTNLIVDGATSGTTTFTAGDLLRFEGDTSVVRVWAIQSAEKAGEILQSVFATPYTPNSDITTVIPSDDTIPQSSEGTQILSVSITPRSTTNKLRARMVGFASGSAGLYASVALFVNATADALHATSSYVGGAGFIIPVTLEWEWTPGATSSQTVNIRVGPSSGTLRMNGSHSGRFFGGVAAATLVVEEIKA